MRKIVIVGGGMLIFFVFHACKKNEQDQTQVGNVDCTTVTYSSTIKPLVQATCMGSSCHGAGSADGDYTSYAGLKTDADNGKLMKEVISNRSMPEGSSYNETQLGQWKCWLDAGAPEN